MQHMNNLFDELLQANGLPLRQLLETTHSDDLTANNNLNYLFDELLSAYSLSLPEGLPQKTNAELETREELEPKLNT